MVGVVDQGAPAGGKAAEHDAAPATGSSLRTVLGDWMVDAVEAIDQNRHSLVWGALLSIASECCWLGH